MAKKSTKSTSQPLFAGFDEPAETTTVIPLNTAAEAVATIDPPVVLPKADSPFTLVGKKVYLVDAYSLIYQVFHVMPEMTGPSGQPVGAAFGFVRDMLDLIEVRQADLLVVTFDHPGDTFRHELYAEYKAQRPEMPADLQPQIPLIHQYLEALGIPAIAIAGYEADDLLATLAKQVDEGGGECLIVTSDKDCRQLITDRVKMYSIRKNMALDKAALLEDWGIRPDQVVDFQALVGDKVDNVPGIAGIGPKTATDLLFCLLNNSNSEYLEEDRQYEPYVRVIELAGLSSRTTHGGQAAVDTCRYMAALLIGTILGDAKDQILAPFYFPGTLKSNIHGSGSKISSKETVEMTSIILVIPSLLS